MGMLNKRTWLLLIPVFLICFLILFILKWTGVPLNARYVLTPLIIQIGAIIYVFFRKPEKPLVFSLMMGFLMAILAAVTALITHTFIWRDIGNEGFADRLLFLSGTVFIVPVIGGLVYVLCCKLSKK